MHWDLEYDVVLVGAGVGSLSAAMILHGRGLKPIIVEKSGQVGGATAYSGGIVWAPCNHRMKAKGISDSRAEALAYLDHVSCSRGDRGIAEAYVDTIPRVVEMLQARTALRWVTYPDLPDYYSEVTGGKMVGRYLLPHGELVREAVEAAERQWPAMRLVRPAVHLGPRRHEWVWGRALVACLWARALEDGIAHLLDHRGISLVRRDGRVEGIIVQGPNRTSAIRGSLGVVLNTGGFEWNEELTRRHVPGVRLHPQTPPANEGDGHIMAAEVGAAFALMDQTIGMPSVCVAGEMNDDYQLYRILFQELALPHSILVNARGRRFANETYFAEVARAWNVLDNRCSFSNLPAFLIFDESYRLKYGMPGGLRTGVSISSHGNLACLASIIGIDPTGLEAEVRDFNERVRRGLADEFGRGSTAYQRAFGDKTTTHNPTTGAIEHPPYYAIEIHPATSGHRGGMIIDENARVIDHRGAVIDGLFACGSCAAGTLTGGNYFTGTAVGHSFVFGTLAAEWIAG